MKSTVTSKYQTTISKAVREKLGIASDASWVRNNCPLTVLSPCLLRIQVRKKIPVHEHR